MKKMLLATTLTLLITGCAQQTFTVKQAFGSGNKGNHHPSFLRFWNWARRKHGTAKICGGAENVVKTEPSSKYEMDCSVLLL